jgi:hypothetical protein
MRDVNGNTGNSNRGNNNTNDDDDDDKGFGDAMGPLNNNHLNWLPEHRRTVKQ